MAFAPFALTVEKWRWSAFAGNIKPDDYNLEWWRLRLIDMHNLVLNYKMFM